MNYLYLHAPSPLPPPPRAEDAEKERAKKKEDARVIIIDRKGERSERGGGRAFVEPYDPIDTPRSIDRPITGAFRP